MEAEKKGHPSGMTLVEVMIMGSIAASVTLAVANGLVQTNRMAKGINVREDWLNLIGVLQATVYQNNCGGIFSTGGPYTYTNGSAPAPGQTPTPLPLSTLENSGSTFLTVGKNLNGIYAQSIQLEEVPGYTTTAATTSTYTDYVFLQIEAKKVLSHADESMTAHYDLFSGYSPALGTFVNPLVFTVTKNSSGEIIGCQYTSMSTYLKCTDVDPFGQYFTSTEAGHSGHDDPNCQPLWYRLQPSQIPASSSSVGQVYFGDLYENNDTTTLNNPPPDSILDHLGTNTLTFAAGTMNLQLAPSANVGIGSASPQAKLDLSSSGSDPLRIANLTSNSFSELKFLGSGRTWAIGAGSASESTYGVPNDWFVADWGAGLGNAMRMIIDSNGNVGVGTTSPQNTLTVAGNVGINNSLTVSGASLNVNSTALIVSGTSVLVGGNPLIENQCSLVTCTSPTYLAISGSYGVYACACPAGQFLVSGGASCSSNQLGINTPAVATNGAAFWTASCQDSSVGSGWSWGGGGLLGALLGFLGGGGGSGSGGGADQPNAVYAYCCTPTATVATATLSASQTTSSCSIPDNIISNFALLLGFLGNTQNANLNGCNLSGMFLNGVNFQNATFVGANLTGTFLQGSNLQNANLSGATLVNISLQGSNLQNANMTNIVGTNMNVDGGNMQFAILTGSSIAGASLTGVNLQSANFTNATATNVNVTGSNMQNAVLTGGNWTGAQMTGVNLQNTNFTNVTATNVNVQGDNMQDAILTGATWSGAQMQNANLKNATGANLTGANTQGATLPQ